MPDAKRTAKRAAKRPAKRAARRAPRRDPAAAESPVCQAQNKQNCRLT